MDMIVEEVLQGKKGAATRFYQTYASKLRRYLLAKLPEEEVEEILQDTFLSAFDSLPLYKGTASISTWLIAIARHEVADFYRKHYVRQIVEKTTPLFDQAISEMESPEFIWQKKNKRAAFVRIYQALSQSYQEILSLRFELGMSIKEISIRMKLSSKATESLLYRARQAFMSAYVTQN